MDKTAAKENKFKWQNYASGIGLIILLIVSAVLSSTFLYPINIMNVAKQIAVQGVLAIGMQFVILLGGIDLSPGAVVALTGVIFAYLIPVAGFIPSVIIVLLFGCALGGVYGWFITRLGIPAFIVTLAGQTICKGVALTVTGSTAISISNDAVTVLGSGNVPFPVCAVIFILMAVYIVYTMIRDLKKKKKGIVFRILGLAIIGYAAYITSQVNGLSILVTIMAVLLFVFIFVLGSTVFGKNVYASGGNIVAARLSGINVNKVVILSYLLCTLMAALGGIMTAGRLGTGSPLIGTNYELDAIAAVVIGGTSMSGGSGKLTGTIIGVLLIGVLNNMLSLLNVSSNMQLIFKGLIILAAVVIDATSNKKKG
ncbi:MAG: sugar ABC transporter permease [Ruminococcus sp.]|jgi:D-xylose transport system permease protein